MSGKVNVEKITNPYSISNDLEYDLPDKDRKHLIYTQQTDRTIDYTIDRLRT